MFMLGDAPANLALKGYAEAWRRATIVWSGCNSTTYMLAKPPAGSLRRTRPARPVRLRHHVLVPTASTGGGFVTARGELEARC